jgi:hypothetical protein
MEEVLLILVGAANWSKKAGGQHVGIVGGFKIADSAGDKLSQPPPPRDHSLARSLACGFINEGSPARLQSCETARVVDDELVGPLGKMYLHLCEAGWPILIRDQKGSNEILGEPDCSIISLIVLERLGGGLHHGEQAIPREVAGLAEEQVRLDTRGGICKQNVTETSVKHAVVPDARCSGRNPGRGNNEHPVVSRTALELHASRSFRNHLAAMILSIKTMMCLWTAS